MTPARAVLIVNAASGRGAGVFERVSSELDRLGVRLAAAHAVHEPGRLAEVVQAELDAGADLVLLGGGDGTISSAVGRIARAGATLVVLPTGTANDFARTLQLPNDPVSACRLVVDGRLADVDLGVAEGSARTRCFVNVSSVGLAVEVTRHLSPTLKRRLRALAYPWAALQAYRRHQPFRARLHFPGGDHPDVELGDLLQVGVANGRYFGGGAVAAPQAGIDDQRLDVHAIPRGTAAQRFTVARHFLSGRFTGADHVLHVRTSAVRVECEPAMEVNIDGEVGPRTPATFSVRPDALRVLVPGGATGIRLHGGSGGTQPDPPAR